MRKFVFVFILPVLLLISSCTATKLVADTSCPGYKNADFNRQDIEMKGIGIMPVLGGDEKEAYRRPMGDEITKEMRDIFGDEKVKSPAQVIATLNDAGIAQDYANAIDQYQTSGIIPRELIRKIGEELGVEYLLYVKLLADSDITTVSYGSYGSSQTSIVELYNQTQVWSVSLGDVVWEGKGGFAKTPSQDIDLVSASAEGIAMVVGNEKGEGPCEDPQDIIDSIQVAAANTIYATTGITIALSLLILLFI